METNCQINHRIICRHYRREAEWRRLCRRRTLIGISFSALIRYYGRSNAERMKNMPHHVIRAIF